jgi:NTP pyrophosphatase (non-canonical NTP hydrolase)
MKETQSYAMTEFEVTQWANAVGITKYGTLKGQLAKLREECDELEAAIEANDRAETRDAIGDIQIVMTMIGLLTDNDPRQCFFESAKIVTKRKGVMNEQGIFVKES